MARKKKQAKRDHCNYKLKTGNKVVYIGETDDPDRREGEHRAAGKKFDRLVCDGPKVSETTAQKRQREALARYRRSHGGKNPKYNKRDDG